ncbi:hypothetical protein M3633_23705, partial [Cytobacillus kochii]|nr:hypothetical protein [Cytobacillus kochii]
MPKHRSTERNTGPRAARDDATPGARGQRRQRYGAAMVTPPFRLAPPAFDDDASNPALPHFNAAVARRMGEIAVNLASRRGLP